jgi:hypothetical protein
MDMTVQIDELLDIANAISRGEVPKYRHDECHTSGAFDLLLVNSSASTAFELLTEACARFERLRAFGGSMEGYYHLLSLLARQADTTEMPPGMPAIIDEYPELSGDLRQWYRCGTHSPTLDR